MKKIGTRLKIGNLSKNGFALSDKELLLVHGGVAVDNNKKPTTKSTATTYPDIYGIGRPDTMTDG